MIGAAVDCAAPGGGGRFLFCCSISASFVFRSTTTSGNGSRMNLARADLAVGPFQGPSLGALSFSHSCTHTHTATDAQTNRHTHRRAHTQTHTTHAWVHARARTHNAHTHTTYTHTLVCVFLPSLNVSKNIQRTRDRLPQISPGNGSLLTFDRFLGSGLTSVLVCVSSNHCSVCCRVDSANQ